MSSVSFHRVADTKKKWKGLMGGNTPSSAALNYPQFAKNSSYKKHANYSMEKGGFLPNLSDKIITIDTALPDTNIFDYNNRTYGAKDSRQNNSMTISDNMGSAFWRSNSLRYRKKNGFSNINDNRSGGLSGIVSPLHTNNSMNLASHFDRPSIGAESDEIDGVEKEWVAEIDEWMKKNSPSNNMRNLEEFVMSLGNQTSVKTAGKDANTPNVNMKMVDSIMRGDNTSSIDCNVVNEVETDHKMFKKSDKNSLHAFFHGVNSKSTAQMNSFYLEANLDLLKRAILDKLKKKTTLFITKKKRDRESLIHDLAKECISGFQILSKGPLKKLDSDFVQNNFGDVVSDYAVKEIIRKKAKKAKLAKVSNEPTENTDIQLNMIKADKELNHLQNESKNQSEDSDFLNISDEKKDSESDTNLSSIKTQILNIPHFMKAFESCELEIMRKKTDLLNLEVQRNGIHVEIQKVKDEMVLLYNRCSSTSNLR